MPSGRALTDAMARTTLAVLQGRPGHVVELGAGTGEITRALMGVGIPASRLVLVERDPEFASYLRRHFHGPRILEGDAARLPRLLASHGIAQVGAVVSGLPLLTLPPEVVDGIVTGAFEVLPHGGAFVQFTYGPVAPIPQQVRKRLRLTSIRGRRIWLNVPPAVVWSFRKAAV